jgi:hypothetical protein
MKVRISQAAHAAITAHIDPFKEWRPGEHLPSGDWRIELSEGTLARLKLEQAPGETLSDTIIRICNTAGRKPS